MTNEELLKKYKHTTKLNMAKELEVLHRQLDNQETIETNLSDDCFNFEKENKALLAELRKTQEHRNKLIDVINILSRYLEPNIKLDIK